MMSQTALPPREIVRHAGRISFKQTAEQGVSRLPGIPRVSGEARLLILFDCTEYQLERHYMYARHRGEGTPYTYANMEFVTEPPGLRTGPWPGWRGIPHFPPVTVRSGRNSAPVILMPWGDETARRSIRGVARLGLLRGEILTCHVGDTRLRPVYADLYEGGTASPPRSLTVSLLPEIASSHPRLLITPAEIPALSEKARGSHRGWWEQILHLLDENLFPWAVTPESKNPAGPERLSGADRSMMAAFAALVDPSRRPMARESFFAYMEETREPGYQPLSIDTQAGETLFLLSLCYDWTHDLWSSEERETIRLWLFDVADRCRAHLGDERRDYGQAHYLGCALGILAFSFLFWDEHPQARRWAGHCRGVLERVISMIPADGFYPHGINLWIYEYGFILRWLELFRVCTGADLWHPTERWRNSSAFRAACTSPDGLYGLTFGDPQFRVGGDSWCHFLIAARTGSREAQWLGEKLRKAPHAGVDFRNMPPRRRVYELLFHDGSVLAERPEEHVVTFPDGGQICVRGTEKSPFLFTFRSGAPLGRQRYSAGEPGGYGHADPSNGSFLVMQGGGPVICGPGPTYRRDTSLHNTITVDGKGQIGDTTVWLPDFFPPEIIPPEAEFRRMGGLVCLRAEMALAYLPHLHVEGCVRTVCVDPGRYILGADSVHCSMEHSIEWNLHAARIGHVGRSGRMIVADLGSSRDYCRLVLLDPPDAEVETGTTNMVPAYTHDGTRISHVRFSVRTSDVRFVWCMLFDRSLEEPRIEGGTERLIVSFYGGRTLSLQDGFFTGGEREN